MLLTDIERYITMDAMAAKIVAWLNEKTQSVLGSYRVRGDLIIPDVRKR